MSERQNQHQFRIGDGVTDQDDCDPSPAVVVNRLTKRADDVFIEATGTTVATENRSYAPDAQTVTVAFKKSLDDHADNWQVSTAKSLWKYISSTDISTYSYPEPRLQLTGTNHIRHRTTEDGDRYIHRLLVTTVGDTLVIGKDYDGVDHGSGTWRKVCFHLPDTTVQEDTILNVVYERENPDRENLPPLLTAVKQIHTISETASPAILLDL